MLPRNVLCPRNGDTHIKNLAGNAARFSVLFDHYVDTSRERINPFSINVPLTDKPGSWFLQAKSLKNTCGRVTF